MLTSSAKKLGGSGMRSSASAMGLAGSQVTSTRPSTVRVHSAGAAWSRALGRRGERSMWITSVCDHMDSTNQPLWKSAVKAAMPATSPTAASSAQLEPTAAGHTTKKSTAKVTISNSELTGPNSSIKPLMDAASQARGRAVQASSTVSHGSAMHTIS